MINILMGEQCSFSCRHSQGHYRIWGTFYLQIIIFVKSSLKEENGKKPLSNELNIRKVDYPVKKNRCPLASAYLSLFPLPSPSCERAITFVCP
jgi:hypothetical protein